MITIICATNRPGNRTQIIAKSYAKILEEIKVSSELFFIEDYTNDFKIEFWKNSSLNMVCNLTLLLSKSNKVLIIVPEYNGSFPGVFKLLIDSIKPSVFKGKFIGLIGVSSGRAGNIRGMDHLVNIFNHLGCLVFPKKIPISNIESLLSQEKLVDKKTWDILKSHAIEFAKV